jgi:O-acetyl-ADP-ribose deacetylase (regulator of RNase III)
MGSGIAPQIKRAFPEAYDADLKTEKGDFNKLGNFTHAHLWDDSGWGVIVVNAYTQYRYGTDKRHLDYEALTLVLRKINHKWPRKSIGLPMIGAGLAGGDWNLIKKIIEKELQDMEVTIVIYDK